MWKIFVMEPFSISLTFNVLLKNQKENNLVTFFNYPHFYKRDWFSKHILSFMKSDGPNYKFRSCSPFDFSSLRLKNDFISLLSILKLDDYFVFVLHTMRGLKIVMCNFRTIQRKRFTYLIREWLRDRVNFYGFLTKILSVI